MSNKVKAAKARFEVRFGKWGAYHYDSQTYKDLTLDEVCAIMNSRYAPQEGTGKVYSAIEKIEYAIAKHGISEGNILEAVRILRDVFGSRPAEPEERWMREYPRWCLEAAQKLATVKYGCGEEFLDETAKLIFAEYCDALRPVEAKPKVIQ